MDRKTEHGPFFILIDPCCRFSRGHHAAVNRLIADYCARNNQPIRIFVNKNCRVGVREALNAEPILSYYFYRRPPSNGNILRSIIEDYNNRIFSELSDTAYTLKDGDTIIIHTTDPWSVKGVYRWIKGFDQVKVRLRLIFLLPPTYKMPANLHDAITEHFLEVITLFLDLDIDVRFYADSASLVRYFENLTGTPFLKVPVSIAFQHANTIAETKRSDDDKLIFLYAGQARLEKGIELLPDAISRFFEKGGRGTFLFQSLDGSPPEIADRLRKLGPDVEILDRWCYGEDYFNFLASGDFILIIYDPGKYNLRTSHIFIESLGIGRPVVVSEHTWMEHKLEELDSNCGIVSPYTSEGIAEALIKCSDRRQSLFNGANQIAEQIRNTYNAKNFLETLLS